MPVYAYRAATRDDQPCTGDVAADSPRQAREVLRGRGLVVLEITETSARKPSRLIGLPTSFRLGNRISQANLSSSIRELSTLLGVGIPLLEGLDVLIKQYTGALSRSFLSLRDRVAGGASLSQAMSEQPAVYDMLTLNMVEVGERAGNLDVVLSQLADFKEKSLELKDRVLTAMMYPAFVLTAAIGVTLFLMTVVVPTLLENLTEAGRALPWPTRVLKGLSDLLTQYGLWVGLAVLGIVLGITAWQRTARGTLWRHFWILRIPILGDMASKQAISRIALVISVLLRSGIEFLRSLEVAGRSAHNRVLEGALEQAGREIQAGQEIGAALERTKVFPPVVVQVFAVGQQTGRLEEMLERLAIDYDRQVASSSARLAAILEPALILVLAVIVGFILFATMLPILEAGNVFEGP